FRPCGQLAESPHRGAFASLDDKPLFINSQVCARLSACSLEIPELCRDGPLQWCFVESIIESGKDRRLRDPVPPGPSLERSEPVADEPQTADSVVVRGVMWIASHRP